MRVFITAGRGHRDYKSHLRVPDGVKMLRPCHQKTLTNQTPPATQNMLAAPERNILGGTAKGGSPADNYAQGAGRNFASQNCCSPMQPGL
jgi:hypothetical protein